MYYTLVMTAKSPWIQVRPKLTDSLRLDHILVTKTFFFDLSRLLKAAMGGFFYSF